MKNILTLIIIAILIFASFDKPYDGLLRVAGVDLADRFSTRQAVKGLRVAIDLDARRDGRRVAVLLEDWLYCYPETGDVFRVPRGYETDFASIPQPARVVINPFGNHAEAAVIHDWLYAVGEAGKRQEADEIFRFAMKEQGVNVVRRNMMFRAVRAGGEAAFGRDDEWNGKFRDTITLAVIDPPLDKPSISRVENIGDCSQFGALFFDLYTKYAT